MSTAPQLAAADALRESHEAAASRIRAQPELSDHGRAMLLAKNYLNAKAKMTDLAQSSRADDSDQRTRAARSAFGATGLPGDPATAVVSYRDAQDRAAVLTSSDAAAALLARAERSGDEPLARAIAAHAFDQSTSNLGRLNPGWDELLDNYSESRPGAARHVATLRDLSSPLGVRDLLAHVLPVPEELWSTLPSQLDALAAAAP